MIFVNNFTRVLAAVNDAAEDAAEEGAKYLTEKIKDRISGTGGPSSPGSPPNRYTGRLIEGTTYTKVTVLGYAVGFKSPASHAHLLEFGTPYMAPRPFFQDTYIREAVAIEGRMRVGFLKNFYAKVPVYRGI